MIGRPELDGSPPDVLQTAAEQRPWFLIALFVAVIFCALAVPVSGLARGVIRLGSVSVPAGTVWRAPLLVLGGPLEIRGESDAPVVIIGGRLRLEGEATDDLLAFPGEIVLGPKSVATGNVISLGGPISVAPGASVPAGMIGSRLPWSASTSGAKPSLVAFVVQRLRLAGLATAALLLLGLGVWTVLPWPALVTTATARRYRIRSACIGIGTVIWAPLIVAPLAVSLAGLPLAVLLALGLGGLWLVGLVSSAVRLGHRLLSLGHRSHSMLTATLVGLIFLGLLPAVPVVGLCALLVAGCIGLGAALVALWDREASGDLTVMQTLAALKFPE